MDGIDVLMGCLAYMYRTGPGIAVRDVIILMLNYRNQTNLTSCEIYAVWILYY